MPDHPQRTGQQNKAIHKYFEMVASALNENGHFFVVQVGEKITKRRWAKDFVKEFIWKPIQFAEFGTTSTKELSTIGPSLVYDHLNAYISGEFGIHVPFPDRFSQSLEKQYNTDNAQVSGRTE